MATKTITIDLEAYGRLKSVQKDTESFSQTIKRVIKPPFDLERWLANLRPLGKTARNAIEQQVAGRMSRSRIAHAGKAKRTGRRK